MNDIKKKKQEVIANMKPVWDEEYRKDREHDKAVWQEKKNQIKCWWTYPWGHIETESQREWRRDGFGRLYTDCMVCNKRTII